MSKLFVINNHENAPLTPLTLRRLRLRRLSVTGLRPLSQTESVAFCLVDMAFGYEQKYGQDTFYLKCIETTLQYFPKCISALMMLNNYYVNIAEQEFAIAGNTPQVLELNQTILNLQDKIDALGYREAPNELKAQWEAEMEAEMQKRAKK